jgi:hypothetical protein
MLEDPGRCFPAGDSHLAPSCLRIEERELEAGGQN